MALTQDEAKPQNIPSAGYQGIVTILQRLMDIIDSPSLLPTPEKPKIA